MMRNFVCTVALLGLFANGSFAADWPQWRGPNRDGVVPEFQAPRGWPKDLRVVWKVPVGEGHASPIVVGDVVYQFARINDKEALFCIDAESGKVHWQRDYAAPYKIHAAARAHGKGPKATPAFADGRVFTFGIDGILSAWDAKTGKPLWQKQFDKQYPNTSPLYGTAASPVIVDGKVITHIGGHDKGSLTAFDVQTGDVKWAWAEDGPGYASPLLARVAGQPQILTQTQNHLVAIAPDTGKLLWKRAYTTEYDQNTISPVLAKNFLLYSGYNKPLAALMLSAKNPTSKPVDAWSNRNHPLYMSTPIVVGNRLFGLSQRQNGHFFCVEADSGKTLWQSDGRMGKHASLLAAGKFILALTNEGNLFVFRNDTDEFTVVAKYRLGDSPTWAHPAIVGDRMWIKDKTTLYCLTWK